MTQLPRSIFVYLLFFLSGICGLIYQIVWVRKFVNIFGYSVYSVSFVTSIFMLGLGLGSYWIGQWSDRRYQEGVKVQKLLWSYGVIELGIGLLGLFIALVLPLLEPLSSYFSFYVKSSEGWYSLSTLSYLLRYLLAGALLLPITFLMGGTLTLLIRYFIQSDLANVGWRVGTLYGINTAGAALGAFSVDFWLIPSLGLFGTQWVAIVLNIGVGLLAIRWAAPTPNEQEEEQPEKQAQAESPDPAPTEAHDPSQSRQRIVQWTGSAIFLSGFAGMGMEVLWFRYLSSILEARRATFSLLLTVILLGIWLGSYIGGFLQRKFNKPAFLFILAQTGFLLTTMGLIFFVTPPPLASAELIQSYKAAAQLSWGSGFWKLCLEFWSLLQVILAIVGIPALFIGFSYPLANACIQRVESTIGTRAGILYLTNTLGAVGGSLLAGFVLLPSIGLHAGIIALGLTAMLAVIPLFLVFNQLERSRETPTPALRPVILACLMLSVGMIYLSSNIPTNHLIKRTYHKVYRAGYRIVKFSEGVNESVMITESKRFGTRRLYIDGRSISGTGFVAQRYMRAFVHLPLLQLKAPKRALVICFGVGNTLHAASFYPSIQRIELAELSNNVLDHGKYFAPWNDHILKNPKVSVFVNDGRQHLRMQKNNTYDLITLEPPPLPFAGTASLYSSNFYQLAKDKLKKGGYITQWLPAYQLTSKHNYSTVRAFLDVFPNAVMLSGYKQELVLMGIKGKSIKFNLEQVKKNLKNNPALRKDLSRIGMNSLTQLLSTFVNSRKALMKTVRNHKPLTDDWPIIEYTPHPPFTDARIPKDFFQVKQFKAWCPDCFNKQKVLPPLTDVPFYLSMLESLYHNEKFLDHSMLRSHPPFRLQFKGSQKKVMQLFRNSRYLRYLFNIKQKK